MHRMQRGPREPTRQTGRKSSGIGLNSRGLHDLFVAHARHRIGFLVHIDANVDNPATIGEALVCHGEFLIKALRVSVLERIFSFFPSLSAIPRELIQHSDFLLCLSCSSRRIARELGIHVRTSYRWCWWLRNAALSYEMSRQIEGTVEADDLYHTAGHKGQAKGGGKKALGRRARGRRKKREPGRGHYDKDRPAIIAWVSRQGAVVIQATRDFTIKTVQKAAELA